MADKLSTQQIDEMMNNALDELEKGNLQSFTTVFDEVEKAVAEKRADEDDFNAEFYLDCGSVIVKTKAKGILNDFEEYHHDKLEAYAEAEKEEQARQAAARAAAKEEAQQRKGHSD